MNILVFNEIAEKLMKRLTVNTDLNISQIRLLLFFDNSGNEFLPMNELAKGLNISLSTLSRQLGHPQTKSFLEFDLTSKDSTKYVRLGQSGLQQKEKIKSAIQELTDNLFSYSDTEEVSFLNSELRMINKRLK